MTTHRNLSQTVIVPWRYIIAICAFAVPAGTGILTVMNTALFVLAGHHLSDESQRELVQSILLHAGVLVLSVSALALLVAFHTKFLSLRTQHQSRLAAFFWIITLSGWTLCLLTG
jgi:hypothetical protein